LSHLANRFVGFFDARAVGKNDQPGLVVRCHVSFQFSIGADETRLKRQG
jgi:hypothetical protein